MSSFRPFEYSWKMRKDGLPDHTFLLRSDLKVGRKVALLAKRQEYVARTDTIHRGKPEYLLWTDENAPTKSPARLLGDRLMQKVPIFDAQHLTSIAKILADTNDGLTGSQIGYLLQDCGREGQWNIASRGSFDFAQDDTKTEKE